MKWYNYLNIAYRALIRNKTRALLTMLGIIIGIASVIAVMTLGDASTNNIKEEISSTGTNMIFIMPVREKKGGVNMGSGSSEALTSDDYEALKKQSTLLTAISPMVSASGQLVYGTNNTPTSLTGVNTEYPAIKNVELQQGIFFSDYDIQTAGKVCAIGTTIIEELFPDGGDPIGKYLRFNNIPLKVIGIVAEKGQSSSGQDQDDVVYVPYTTVQRRMLAITYFQTLTASCVSEQQSEAAVAEITDIMRRSHKLTAKDEDDFDIRTQAEMLSMISNVTGMLTTLLSAVAAISLLVGGIGIMNIMYVTVTERTKEIGLRMSIGAQKRFVMMQFLCESVILSIVGGFIGVIFGVLISYLVSLFVGWTISISISATLLAFGISFIEGVFFGWYPAKKAAKLDPIVALRYE